MGHKKTTSFYVIIGLCIFSLLVCSGVGLFFVHQGLKQEKYKEHISLAKQHYSEARYSDAIVEYRDALEVREDKEDAYIGLANSYLAIGKTASATMTLERGYQCTRSSLIASMLAQVKEKTYLVNTLDQTSQKINVTAGKSKGWNEAFLQKIENYTNEDYEDEFGGWPDIMQTSDGGLNIIYGGLGAVFHYADTPEDSGIVDEAKKRPGENAMPEKMMLDDVTLLFVNCTCPVSVDTVQKFSSTKIEMLSTKERTYIKMKYNTLTIKIETDKSGNITSPNAWNEIEMEDANASRLRQEDDKGTVQGIVINAVDGNGVPSATITFTGRGSSSNRFTAATSMNGTFSAKLPADMYRVKIEAEDYITEEFDLEVEKGQNYYGLQFTISPNLLVGTVRIVLEWGAEPLDLDSYLTGETNKGEDMFVSFRNPVCSGRDGVLAELDVDDVNGYGPETITLYELNGKYEYRVVDYRATNTMQEKGATVKVYLPDGSSPMVISLSSASGVQNCWEVFTIEDGKVTVTNRSGDNRTSGSGSK